jgi:hypothetical protein
MLCVNPPIRVHAEIMWKPSAITETLQVAGKHFTSSFELARAKSKQAVVIARLDFMTSMTEALTSRVFKRPVLWDNRIKDYHNRDFVDKEMRNLSQTLHLFDIGMSVHRSISSTIAASSSIG